MRCSHCGFEAAAGDRVCRRCKGWLDRPGRIAVGPPRAGRRTVLFRWRRGYRRIPPPLRVVVGIVPGLGHALAGETHRGERVFLAVYFLVGAAWLCGGSLLLVGIAAGVHAQSLLDLLPAAARAPQQRLLVLVGLNFALFLLLYQPLLGLFAALVWEREMGQAPVVGSLFWGLVAVVALLPVYRRLHRLGEALGRRRAESSGRAALPSGAGR